MYAVGDRMRRSERRFRAICGLSPVVPGVQHTTMTWDSKIRPLQAALIGLLAGALLSLGSPAALAVSFEVQAPAVDPTVIGEGQDLDFSIQVPGAGDTVYVEVSSNTLTQPDGTFAWEFTRATVVLRKRSYDPTGPYVGNTAYLNYTGKGWLAPGAYFWRAVAYAGCFPGPCVSPMRTLSVTPTPAAAESSPPAPPPAQEQPAPTPASSPAPSTPASPKSPPEPFLRLWTAKSRARSAIVRRYRASRPKVLCERADRSSFDCTVRWRTKRGKRHLRSVAVFYEGGRLKVEIPG